MRIFLIIICILSVILFTIYSDQNRLDLTFGDGIRKQDIRVRMEVLGSVKMTEIYNGSKEFDIPNGYGENEWHFSYSDSLQGYIRHFKTNRKEKHDYNFSFFKENEQYFVGVNIEGDQTLKDTIELKRKN